MSTTREKIISFREDPKILESLDALADSKGIDRSDILRMIVREKLNPRTETDSKTT